MSASFERARLRSLLVLPLLAGLLIGGLAALAVGMRPASFESRALILVDQPGIGSASGDGAVIDKLLRLRAKYAGLVITDRIAQPVAEDLTVPIEDVRGRLTAVPVEGTTLLALAARGDDAQQAQALTQSAAEALVADVAADQAQYSIPQDSRVQLSVVTPAQEPTRLGTSPRRLTGVAVLSGALAAALVAAALVALRPGGSLRSQRPGGSGAASDPLPAPGTDVDDDLDAHPPLPPVRVEAGPAAPRAPRSPGRTTTRPRSATGSLHSESRPQAPSGSVRSRAARPRD